jgi:hypothetical protein
LPPQTTETNTVIVARIQRAHVCTQVHLLFNEHLKLRVKHDVAELTHNDDNLVARVLHSTLRALDGLADTPEALTTLTDLSEVIRKPSGRGALNNAARDAQDQTVSANAAKLIERHFPGSSAV